MPPPLVKDNLDVIAIPASQSSKAGQPQVAIMDNATNSTEDSRSAAELTKAADKHGIALTAAQARMGAEWRDPMLNAVDSVRQLDVDGYEPAAVFTPVERSNPSRGG